MQCGEATCGQAFCVVAKPGVAGESSVMVVRSYSTYFEQLEKHVKDRYIEKLNYIGPEVDDPCAMPVPASPCSDSLPEAEYPDIYSYLINKPSPVTKEELKAYKSMEDRPFTYTVQPAG